MLSILQQRVPLVTATVAAIWPPTVCTVPDLHLTYALSNVVAPVPQKIHGCCTLQVSRQLISVD
jgi:hypothetical protein